MADARPYETKYRPDQLRDELGRFADEGGEGERGGGGGGASPDDLAHPKLRGTLPAPTPREVLAARRRRSYKVESETLNIPENVHRKLQAIGEDYTRATGKVMVVTSGTRTPLKQAEAMFDKFDHHAGSIYSDKVALAEIKREYDRGLRQAKSEASIKAAMADVIKGQVDRGVYISRHLRNGAADIRVGGANVAQLRIAIVRNGGSVLNERNHLHVQFGGPRGP